jgi:hypothetical protein
MVLVVDDNEGLVELLDDYLTGHLALVVAVDKSAEVSGVVG